MTHACRPAFPAFPDFSVPPPAPATVMLTPAGDPVLAAIEAHAEAWAALQVAPEGMPARRAAVEESRALTALLGTPCLTRTGALALIRHLRWYAREEAVTGEGEELLGRLVLAREADLSRFVGSDLPPEHLPTAAPLGRLAAQVVRRLPPPPPVAPGRHPRAALLARVAGLGGEAIAALGLIAGGAAATALASLL